MEPGLNLRCQCTSESHSALHGPPQQTGIAARIFIDDAPKRGQPVLVVVRQRGRGASYGLMLMLRTALMIWNRADGGATAHILCGTRAWSGIPAAVVAAVASIANALSRPAWLPVISVRPLSKSPSRTQACPRRLGTARDGSLQQHAARPVLSPSLLRPPSVSIHLQCKTMDYGGPWGLGSGRGCFITSAAHIPTTVGLQRSPQICGHGGHSPLTPRLGRGLQPLQGRC